MTREIPLTQGNVALVDDCDFEYLSQFNWGATWDGWNWYARRHSPTVNGYRGTVIMHREILSAPKGVRVDHKDGDGLNNQRGNLRSATHQQNLFNRGMNRNNTSGYKGVCWDRRISKWFALIKTNDKGKYLGSFSSPEEAARAYDKAALELHGDFAYLNFPLEELL